MVKTSGQIEREKRRKMRDIVIEDFSVCYNCNSSGLNEDDKYCPNCRFPQQGTQGEMRSFMHVLRNKKKLLNDQKKAIRKARIILFVLAALNFVLGIILYAFLEYGAVFLVIEIILAAIYFSMAIWSKKRPFAAIVSGFFIYMTLIIVSGVFEPATIYQGIIWKVIIISGFIYGYKGAKESLKLEEELRLNTVAVKLEENNAL